ncbi:uncharacterized protein LOC133910315 [Phragmites australis]|uniref:uncharacterized protein LOC133910315 n=1 Tax=Phragmites australis TaxID=29695 RepID=UPI002D79D727|nr:uncharacterized protein LOC133910315 [Phragmites australis]
MVTTPIQRDDSAHAALAAHRPQPYAAGRHATAPPLPAGTTAPPSPLAPLLLCSRAAAVPFPHAGRRVPPPSAVTPGYPSASVARPPADAAVAAWPRHQSPAARCLPATSSAYLPPGRRRPGATSMRPMPLSPLAP